MTDATRSIRAILKILKIREGKHHLDEHFDGYYVIAGCLVGGEEGERPSIEGIREEDCSFWSGS